MNETLIACVGAALIAGLCLGVFIAGLRRDAHVEDARNAGFREGRASRDAEVEALAASVAVWEDAYERAVAREERWEALVASQTQRLTDHRVRVERHEAGLPEVEVAPRGKQHPWSKELREWVSGFKMDESRKAVIARADRLLYLMPADEVLAQLKQESEVAR